MRRVYVCIAGDVQGVGYRKWAREIALRLHLRGRVKNRDDGSVEIIAEGTETELQEFICLCHKGPEVSWVESVDVTWASATNEYTEFDILKV